MTTGKKIALGVVIFFLVLVAGLAIVVPMLLDVDRYRPQVAQHIEAQTGKPASIGHLGLTVFPTLAIRVDNLSLGNPAGFPQGTFLEVRRVTVALDAAALWNREILIRSLDLDRPTLNLLSDVRGRWNFENPPQARAARTTAADKPPFTLGVIAKVSINRADFAAANLLPSGRPGPTFFEARGLSTELEHVDLNAFAGSSSASRIAPASHAPELAMNGWWNSVVYAATPNSVPAAAGRPKADSLRFGTLEVTNVKTKLRLLPKQIYFDDLTFDLYGGRATGALAVDIAPANPRYSTHAQLSGVDVARLFAAFPAARGKMSGTMDGTVKLAGEVSHSPDPLAGMRGTGEVSIKNGQLPSLQLNRNLMTLARLANLGPAAGDPSSFSSVAADFNIANDKISSQKITVVGNGVDMDSSGSVSLAGEGGLDYQGVARLAATPNAVSNLLQGLTGATTENGKLSFPFTIAGTLSNPKFLLKSLGSKGQLSALKGLAATGAGQQAASTPGQTPQQPADLVQGLAGLLKKKKPPPPATKP